MAEKRKFAALAELHRQPPKRKPRRLPKSEPRRCHRRPQAGKGRGRPPTGKRSNPEWKLYSHFLKRRHSAPQWRACKPRTSGRDLSDVLQELLENWLKA